MSVHSPIEARSSRLPAWALGITVFLFLVGAVYGLSNLSGENPPLAIPGATVSPGVSGPPNPAIGQALTEQASPPCSTCHGQNWEGGVGPALVGIDSGPQSENLQDLAAEYPDTWIHLWIDGTGPEVEGLDRMGMPEFGTQYSPEQIDTIVAYLRSL